MMMTTNSTLILAILVAFGFFVSSTPAEREIPKEIELIPITSDPEVNADLTVNENGEELCEGDIVCGENEKEEGSNRNALTDEAFRWPKKDGLVIVPYVFAADATAGARKQVVIAAADYAAWTCIKFVERTDQNDYINIVNKKGCWASLGRKGGIQEMSLQQGCDFGKGVITHEMMHALGFEHEHNRSDRDEYITIRENHIEPSRRGAFNKCTRCTDPVGLSYDYRSITHYNPKLFSKAGEDVIIPKNPEDRELMGQRIGLCLGDIKKLNQMYKCGGVTASPVKPNHGIVPCDGDKHSYCAKSKRRCADPEDDYRLLKECPSTCFGMKKGDPYDRNSSFCQKEANDFSHGHDHCVVWPWIRDHCSLTCSERKGTTVAN